MLSTRFLRNFLPVGKDFTIFTAGFLRVGNGIARPDGEVDKLSELAPAPDTGVLWALYTGARRRAAIAARNDLLPSPRGEGGPRQAYSPAVAGGGGTTFCLSWG
jgi:hypothetical protein